MKKTTKRKETKRPDNDPPISEKNDTENKQIGKHGKWKKLFFNH